MVSLAVQSLQETGQGRRVNVATKTSQWATPCCFPDDKVHASCRLLQAFVLEHDGACGGPGDPRGWQVLDINITATFVKQNVPSRCLCRAPQS